MTSPYQRRSATFTITGGYSMMPMKLTHDGFQKNDARTRSAWMLCAGAEKWNEKDVFLHSIDRDEAGIFDRSCIIFFNPASRHRSPA
jgi:hypothetical protein